MDFLLEPLRALPSISAIGIVTTTSALGVVLLAERIGWARLNAIFKPIASAGFLLAAFGHPGVGDSAYNVLIAISLVFGAAGDVLLIPRGNGPIFRAGILSFLASHVIYVAAFAARGLAPLPTLIAIGVVAGPAWLIWRYLRPHVQGSLAPAVVAYIAVISVMVAASFGAAFAGTPATPLIAVAAVAFFLSDITVARQRFVVKAWWHRAVGLPLYFGSQFLFIATYT
jgi:uncharacterized membrane protein YhhN